MSWLSSLFRNLFGRPTAAEPEPLLPDASPEPARFRLFGPGRPSTRPPPAAKGEYRIVNTETGEIGYIGQTNNLQRRKREHERSRPELADTHRFEWKTAHETATSQDLKEHERKKIRQKKPPFNKRAGGGGPNAKQ